MTSKLIPCGDCGRHVRSDEERCPFCRAAISPSRAALTAAVALSAGLSLAGCGPREVAAVYGGPPPPPPEVTAVPSESASAPQRPAPSAPPAPTAQPALPKTVTPPTKPPAPPPNAVPAYGAPPPPGTNRR